MWWDSCFQKSSSLRSVSEALTRVERSLVALRRDVEGVVHEPPDTIECRVCMCCACTVVFAPCGHVAACVRCAARCDNCPICLGRIEARIRFYVA
jgi:hypothetical protein